MVQMLKIICAAWLLTVPVAAVLLGDEAPVKKHVSRVETNGQTHPRKGKSKEEGIFSAAAWLKDSAVSAANYAYEKGAAAASAVKDGMTYGSMVKRNKLNEVQSFAVTAMLSAPLLERIVKLEMPTYLKAHYDFDLDMDQSKITACDCMFDACKCQPDQVERSKDPHNGGVVKVTIDHIAATIKGTTITSSMWIELGVGQTADSVDGKGKPVAGNRGKMLFLDLDLVHAPTVAEDKWDPQGWQAKAKRAMLRTGMKVAGVNSILGLRCKLQNYWMRMSKIQADEHGNMGIGLSFKHFIDEEDAWFPPQLVPFPFTYLSENGAYEAAQDMDPNDRQRLAVIFTDGLLEAASGRASVQYLMEELADQDAWKSKATQYLTRKLASTNTGERKIAQLMNWLLVKSGYAQTSTMEQLSFLFYRMAGTAELKTEEENEEYEYAATVAVADLTDQEQGVLESLNFFRFREEEDEVEQAVETTSPPDATQPICELSPEQQEKLDCIDTAKTSSGCDATAVGTDSKECKESAKQELACQKDEDKGMFSRISGAFLKS